MESFDQWQDRLFPGTPASVYVPWGRSTPMRLFLDIRGPVPPDRAAGGAFPLSRLIRIDYVELGTGAGQIKLEWPSWNVLLGGEHLTPLRDALLAGEVDFIQQYCPERWPTVERGAPLVHSARAVMERGAKR